MSKKLTAAERLIVAADFQPEEPGHGRGWVYSQVFRLANDLAGTGVVLKVNSALRACGYGLINDIHDRGLRVFADLKLFDIPNTLKTDGTLLREVRPELVTVVCAAGYKAMMALDQELPETEVLGITMLTSLVEADSRAMFECDTIEAALRLANQAEMAHILGLVSSGAEVSAIARRFGTMFTINTPAIRPEWAIVKGDDQNSGRIMTPANAIKAGATRIVVGRPILNPPTGMSRRDAVMRTIEEIDRALA